MVNINSYIRTHSYFVKLMKDRINADLKEAMKAKDELRLSVLRMLSASIKNIEIGKREGGSQPQLTDGEILKVISSEMKKRKDAAEGFSKGGKEEMAQKELEEAKILELYLPAQLSDEEIEQHVKAAVAELGEVTQKDFGKVMKDVMARVQGLASGDRVSAAVKKILF